MTVAKGTLTKTTTTTNEDGQNNHGLLLIKRTALLALLLLGVALTVVLTENRSLPVSFSGGAKHPAELAIFVSQLAIFAVT